MATNMRYKIVLVLSFLLGFTIAYMLQNNDQGLNTQVLPTNAYSEAPVAPQDVVKEESVKDLIARITCYGPTGNKTSSGKIPQEGMVASSDRTIPLGTKVVIEGYGEMTIEDRTAKWVHEKKGFTLDIFLSDGCTNHFGTRILSYSLIK